MKTFSVGDKVAVLDSVLKGTIIKIVDKQIIIKTADGFQMDFFPNELVKIEQEQIDLSKYNTIHLSQMLHEKQLDKPKKSIQKSIKIDKLPILEVDLHIQNLIPSTKGMGNYEILTLQLNEAERQIKFAINKKIQRMVFIHGVGEGILQQNLEDLFQKYKVDYFAASFQKYGMGATEIYIYQNTKET